MTENLFLVFSNPTEGNEARFDDWYDNTHLAEVLAVPGVVSAQRYELAPMAIPGNGVPPPPHRYLAVYGLDREPDGVMAEFVRQVGSGEMLLDESLDLATVSMCSWRPRGARLTTQETGGGSTG
jgi:hypothetical protein